MTAQISDSFYFNNKKYDIGAVSDPMETLFNPNELGLVMRWTTTACYRGYYVDYALDKDNILVVNNLHGNPISDKKPLGKRFRELVEKRYQLYKKYNLLYFQSGKERKNDTPSEETKKQLDSYADQLQQLDQELKPFAEIIDREPSNDFTDSLDDYLTMARNVEEAPEICGVKPQYQDSVCDMHYHNLNYPVHFSGSLIVCHDFIWEMYEHMGFHDPMKYREVWRMEFDDGRLVKAQNESQLAANKREKAKNQQNHDLFSFIEDSFSLDFDKKWFED